jgi:phosphoglycolate phosphatase
MSKLIVFDLDGTLINAYEAIERSLNFTLKALGYPKASAYAARRAVGHGDVNFMRRFFNDKDLPQAIEIYRRHHAAALVRYSQLMPQARMVLSRLKKKDYKLAVASNRPLKFSNILLRHLKIRKYFTVVLCGKDSKDIKPKPTLILKIMKMLGILKEDTAYIGDMTIDVLAGKNAGVKAIAISGGTSTVSELKKARPFKIISRLPELLKILHES